MTRFTPDAETMFAMTRAAIGSPERNTLSCKEYPIHGITAVMERAPARSAASASRESSMIFESTGSERD